MDEFETDPPCEDECEDETWWADIWARGEARNASGDETETLAGTKGKV